MVGPSQCLQHIGSLFAAQRNVIGLVQQFLGLFRFVQVRDQFRLQVVLDKVHQEMHDGLGHRVLDRLAYDVEIRLDQAFDDIAIALFLVGQFARRVVGGHVRQQIDRLHGAQHTVRGRVAGRALQAVRPRLWQNVGQPI